MKIDVTVTIPGIEVYDLLLQAQSAMSRNGSQVIYTYHTEGRHNWLDLGVHHVNALGFVLLPRGLPETIELAPDLPAELPCLYELDEHDEATGQIEFFCSDECLRKGLKTSSFGKCVPGASRSWINGSLCTECHCELDEVEDHG